MTATRDTVLSVIIPTFNYAKVIGRAVCSVALQMNETTELIVIDDGSSDNTPDVLTAISLPSTVRFHHVRQKNAGPASARNCGIRLSVGRFLLFLDADDELLPGAIKTVLDTISEHRNPELILGAYLAHFSSGKEKLVLPTQIYGNARERVTDFLLKKKVAISHGSSVVRRDFLERRPYPENLRQTEDIPVFAYLVAYAQPVLIKYALVRVNKHSHSLRHDAELARNAHQYLAAEVFSKLPDECLLLRPDFEAKRLFSVFRICYQSGDWIHAKSYYQLAFSANWQRALRLKYLIKYLRIMMQRSKSS